MSLFVFFHDFFTQVKDWQLLVVYFAFPILWFIVCCPLRNRKVFRAFSECMIVLGFVVIASSYSLTDGLFASLLFFAESRIFDRLIPIERKQEKPPKVVCFDPPIEQPRIEIASHSLDETNLCLDHAFEVADHLKQLALEGSDRLEIDNIELTLKMYRRKGMLTDREMRSLNDCLALLLKYTAKYDCTF